MIGRAAATSNSPTSAQPQMTHANSGQALPCSCHSGVSNGCSWLQPGHQRNWSTLFMAATVARTADSPADAGGAGDPRVVGRSTAMSEELNTSTPAASLRESAFLRACRRETVPHTPVWFMRQAGRSLPEYRRLREGSPMLDSCMRPDLVTEITLQPVRRYGVDAAIFFSDIVLPLKAIGVDLDIKPGVGPVVAQPIRSRADLAQLRALDPGAVPFVTEAVRQLVGELGATPLIGFAG